MTTIARATTPLTVRRGRRDALRRLAAIAILIVGKVRGGLHGLIAAGRLGSSVETDIGRATGARI